MIESQLNDRIAFKGFEFEHLPHSRCGARVVLGWPDGEEFVGTAQAEDTQTGRLWCAAEATAQALEQSVNHKIALKVMGVQTILEAETRIIVTLLSGRALSEAQELVGSCVVGEQSERSAALSVLKATNRLMGKVISSRPS